jgi:SAM-dependent methyltransferase
MNGNDIRHTARGAEQPSISTQGHHGRGCCPACEPLLDESNPPQAQRSRGVAAAAAHTMVGIAPGNRLLDIGCGWGSLLVHAAIHHGVHGVGVTLSDAQAQFARERIAEAGLNDRLEVRVCDYRELRDGPYDRIASVGMYEHVARSELERYACTVADLLRPGGLFLNHGIARLDSEAPTEDTFIAGYIFPDGELHLVGCAQAFEDGEIGVYQVLRARVGGPHDLPLDRALLGADETTSTEASGHRSSSGAQSQGRGKARGQASSGARRRSR